VEFSKEEWEERDGSLQVDIGVMFLNDCDD
jgi:hypothetical protein